jgi:tetratricopeptide (TPR) repeat protein
VNGDEVLSASLHELARIRRDRDELDEAAALARESLEQAEAAPRLRNGLLLASARLVLGELLLRLDELSEAEELLTDVLADAPSSFGVHSKEARDALRLLVELHEKRGETERAAGLRAALEASAAAR